MMPNIELPHKILDDRREMFPELHDYQWEGVSFLVDASSALLADEMGLGKTAQAIAAFVLLLDERNDIDRVLVVAPASLTLNWMAEISTWAPSVTARRVQGDISDREAFYMLPIPVLVSSYEQIREDGLERIPPDSFDLVILDEAQRIKNRDSATSLACRLLPRKRSWALSATPLENNSDDVTSILDFLDPELGRHMTRSQMSKKLERVMLRRRKRDVRADLPEVIVQDIRLDLSLQQRERYDALWMEREEHVRGQRDGDSTAVMLGLITRLKMICNFDPDSGKSTKLDVLRTIGEGVGEAARIIVFSQFVETLRWVSERIDVPHELLTGSMHQDQRQAVIHRFKTGPSPRALLISLRAGGVGLNLGEASHVILFDRWWNPAVEAQAVYRAHRFERDEPLHVVRFLVRDSIEERIADILGDKEDLFTEVIDAGGMSSTGPTKQNLLEILQLTESSFLSRLHES